MVPYLEMKICLGSAIQKSSPSQIIVEIREAETM